MSDLFTVNTGPDNVTIYKCEFCEFQTGEQLAMARHHNEQFKDRCQKREWSKPLPTADDKKRKRQERRKARRLKKRMIAQGLGTQGEPVEGDEDDMEEDDEDDDDDDDDEEEEEKVPAREKEESVWKEQKGPNAVLFEVVKTYPDLQPQHIAELMSWAKMKGQLHPMEVNHLLSNMKGVSDKVANLLAQKYTLALQIESNKPNADIQMVSLLSPMAPGQQMGQMPSGVPPMQQQQALPPQQTIIQTPYGPATVFQPQPQYPNMYGQQPSPYGQQFYQPPQQNSHDDEFKRIIAKQSEMIENLQYQRQKDKEDDEKRRDQEILEARLRKIDEEGNIRMEKMLEEIRALRDEKDDKRSASAKDEMLMKLESMHADVRDRLRDVESRYSNDSGSPALRVELAKLNKQSDILTKSMTNFHDTVKTGMSHWAESQKPSPLEGRNIAENQLSDADLKKLEKELKKGP